MRFGETSGFDPQPAPRGGGSDDRTMSKEDRDELSRLDAARKAAFEALDRFCLEIERRYNLSGLRWDVDFGTGEIKITGRKPLSAHRGQ